MYAGTKRTVLAILRLPERPPDPPADGYKSVQVFRASARWLSYRLVLFWIGAGVFACALLAAGIATLATGQWWGTALVLCLGLLLGALLVVSWFCVRIEWDLRTYVVTDRSLRVRQGAWTFQEMTLTYANVQNVTVTQGPLQRLFGIEDLRVDTAGGGVAAKGEHAGASGHNVTLAGLENARAVRDLILDHVKKACRGSGLGDLDDPVHGSPGSRLESPAVVEALASLHATTQGLRAAVERRTRPI